MAPVVGHRRPLRVPELGAALPHRDVHAEPLDVRDGRHQRLRPAGRRRRAVRAPSTGTARPAGSSSARWSTRSSRPTQTAATTCRRSGAGAATPAFDAWVQPDPSAWGRHAGGYGQSETMGMATFNLLGPAGIGITRPPVAARRSPRRRTRRRRGRGGGDRRDRGARHHGHVRLLEPTRPQRRARPRRLASHQRPGAVRGRRDLHVRRSEGADVEVGRGEHLSRRSGELREAPPRGRRLRGDRRTRRDVGAVGEGDRRRRRRCERGGRRDRRPLQGADGVVQEAARSSNSSTCCRAPVRRSTTTRSTPDSAVAVTPAAAPARSDPRPRRRRIRRELTR